MTATDMRGEDRCWPCTLANSVVGLLVAWIPLAAALLNGDPAVITGTVVWGLLVTTFTWYRLLKRGYLPGAKAVAKATGLHERIGPNTGHDGNERD